MINNLSHTRKKIFLVFKPRLCPVQLFKPFFSPLPLGANTHWSRSGRERMKGKKNYSTSGILRFHVFSFLQFFNFLLYSCIWNTHPGPNHTVHFTILFMEYFWLKSQRTLQNCVHIIHIHLIIFKFILLHLWTSFFPLCVGYKNTYTAFLRVS